MDPEKMRKLRKSAGLTQEDLAKTLGVNRATVSKYENGLITPSIDQLEAIANALSVAPFDIMEPEVRDVFFSGYNFLYQTRRSRAAKTEDEWEEAEDDAISLVDYFDELDKFGQKRALACVRAATGRPPIIDAEPPHDIDLTVTALYQLNPTGQMEARKRVEELTEIPRYRAETTPQSTPAPAEEQSTIRPTGAPEKPEEGEQG